MKNIKLGEQMSVIDIKGAYVEICLAEKTLFCNLPYSSNMLINHMEELKKILKKYKNYKVLHVTNEYDLSTGCPYMVIQLKID